MEPRNYASESTRKGFGRQTGVEWPTQPNRSATAELFAAWLQHQVVFGIQAHLRKILNSSIAALADELNVSRETLQRKFRGEAPATSAELFDWCMAVGRLDILFNAVLQLEDERVPLAPADGSGVRPKHDRERVDAFRIRRLPPQRG